MSQHNADSEHSSRVEAPANGSSRRPPNRRHTSRRLWLIVAMSPLWAPLLFYGCIRLAHPNAGPENIRIAEETTYVTEPLDEEGFVDYVAAMNRRASKGVTPENNAAVLLMQAFGPTNEMSSALQDEFFRQLGMQKPPTEGDYFILADDFVQAFPELARSLRKLEEVEPLEEGPAVLASRQREKEIDSLQQALDEAVGRRHWQEVHAICSDLPQSPYATPSDLFHRQIALATMCPWEKRNYPAVAAWLAKNEKPLDLIVQASERPRFFLPVVTDSPTTRLLLTDLRPLLNIQDAANALLARAMLCLAEGQADAAWRNVFAAHRLSRLVGQHPMMIGGLTSIRLENDTLRAENAMLARLDLPPEMIAEIRADLKDLPPRTDMIEKIDFGERLQFLDTILSFARHGVVDEEGIQQQDAVVQHWNNSVVNWNNILSDANELVDAVVTESRSAISQDDVSKVVDAEKKCERLISTGDHPLTEFAGIFVGSQREKTLKTQLFKLMPPSTIRVAVLIHQQCRDKSQMNELAFAVMHYRSDHGIYPSKLESLIPNYIESMPVDVYEGQLYRYTNKGTAFLLHGVGPNRKDDGGVPQYEGGFANGEYDHVLEVPPRIDVRNMGLVRR